MTFFLLWTAVLMLLAVGFAFYSGNSVALGNEHPLSGTGIAIVLLMLSTQTAFWAGIGQLPNKDNNNRLLSAGTQYEVLTSVKIDEEKNFVMLIKKPDGSIVSYANTNLPPPVFIYTPDGKSLFTAIASTK